MSARFFEDDSDVVTSWTDTAVKYSLAVNSVGLIVSHESTGVSYRWLKSARTLLQIVQLTFRYLDQIRLDVIESEGSVQHLYRC